MPVHGEGFALYWNLPQHSYEEIRQAVIDILLASHVNGVNQFSMLEEHVGREFGRRAKAPQLPTGVAYPGAGSQLHPNDANMIVEVVWDLFRQGIITFGLKSSNPTWPWLRLSRFGERALEGGYHNRFHDVDGYLKLLRAQVPDISDQAVVYLEEAVASFYSDCLLACVVMLGVAAEAEFIRMVDVSAANATHGNSFGATAREVVIGKKIKKFRNALEPIRAALQPKTDFEDLDTNLAMIQSVLRIARNEAGHPTGQQPPQREQAYIYLQLFVPFARQLMKLRMALA